MRKIFSLFISIIFTISVCSGCACAKNEMITYKNFYTQDVTTFNYMITNEYHDTIRIANLVDGLVENDKYGNIVPSIASSWTNEIIDKKQVWTFHLKDNVYWSDYKGNKYSLVTANDFVTSLKYILNYNSQSNNYSLPASLLENGLNYYNATMLSNYKYDDILDKINSLDISDPNNEITFYTNIKKVFEDCNLSGACVNDFNTVGVKALDDFTLQFTLATPVPYFLHALTYVSFLPANESFIKEIGFNNFGTSKKTLLYNGAYLLDNYSHSSKIEYLKNPNYWDVNNVFIDKLIFTKLMNYASTGYYRLAYESGNIDEFAVNQNDTTAWNKYVIGKNNEGSISSPIGDNTYVADVSSNYTNFYFIINQNRTNSDYTTLTDDELSLANKALSNLNFRKALSYGLDFSLYLNGGSNTKISSIVPEGFIYNNEKDYIDYFINYYASKNGITYSEAKKLYETEMYYNPELSNHYLNLALKELNIDNSSLPIKLEYTYYYDNAYTIYDKARIETWNKLLNGCSLEEEHCEYNKIMIVYNSVVDSLIDYDNAFENKEYNLTFIGLYPDFVDPTTYLNAFSSNGELTKFLNHSDGAYIDNLLKEISSYYSNDELDERYKLCAELEYYILFESNLIIPIYLKGNNSQIVVSNLVPYQKMKASYGLSSFKFKHRKIRTVSYTQTDIARLKEEYESGLIIK